MSEESGSILDICGIYYPRCGGNCTHCRIAKGKTKKSKTEAKTTRR
jgi:hypothetical protein